MYQRQFHLELDATQAKPTLRLVVNNSAPFHKQRTVKPQTPAKHCPILRVVHNAGGQVRISGRFSDVCAELDRLEAYEAQMRLEHLERKRA